jgi:hypothetical protein
MLNINTDTIRFIIDKAHEFQMLGESGDQTAEEGGNPAFAELKATIDDLEPDQQVCLVTLMWVGRGDYSVDEWPKAVAHAGESWTERTAEYLIGTPLLSDYLTEGLDQVDAGSE